MIVYINGRLITKEPTHVVIESNGLGYEVKISLNTYSKIPEKEQCKLHTHLNIKEDSHTLYGFSSLAEKSLFLLLISVSGVGPNTALMVLSSMKEEELEAAILREDSKSIQAVKGIGAKTAQRIILELKDKVGKNIELKGNENSIGAPSNMVQTEALSALMMLGIPRNAAQQSINKALKGEGGNLPLEELIKKALKTV